MNQIKLDFSKSLLPEPKKMVSISFKGSEELEEFLNLVSAKSNMPRSALIHDLVVKGLSRMYENRLLTQPHLNKSLSESIEQGLI